MSEHEASAADLNGTITADVLVHQSESTDNAPLDNNTQTEEKVLQEDDIESKEKEDDAENLRRSQRTRTLTEKGQCLEEDRIRNIQHRFTTSYEKWKLIAKEAKKVFNESIPNDILGIIMARLDCATKEVAQAYNDLRRHITPETQIRRRVDTCVAVSEKILTRATNRIERDEDDESSESSWKFTFSSSQPSASRQTVRTRHSTQSAAKKQEAAAELAATQATLEVLDVMQHEKQQLEILEAENRQRLAQQEAENAARQRALEEENAARQRALEEKRRQLERLDAVKKMNAARARLQVYEQEQEVGSDSDILELLEDNKSMQMRSAPKSRGLPVQGVTSPQQVTHAQQARVVQATTSAQQMPHATMSQPAAIAQQEDSATSIARAAFSFQWGSTKVQRLENVISNVDRQKEHSSERKGVLPSQVRRRTGKESH